MKQDFFHLGNRGCNGMHILGWWFNPMYMYIWTCTLIVSTNSCMSHCLLVYTHIYVKKGCLKYLPKQVVSLPFFEFIGQITLHHSGVHWAVSMLPMLESPSFKPWNTVMNWNYKREGMGSYMHSEMTIRVIFAWRLNMIDCCPRWDKHRWFIGFFSILNNSIWRGKLGS